ncbi:MAG: dienelactone hydrolase family protein [Candidatus Eremiobacteraeota bacterium]|nr:dienelactone hydrolase family protein [Candidatus Eremiobacteraeota bacterium]
MSDGVTRRRFVGTGAGAAVALGSAGVVQAQPEGFGKPHPPIVAEDDAAISVLHPRLTPVNGGPIGAYAAEPRTRTHLTPGVVVIQAIWGVDAQLRDVVRRFAKAGFIAIAPQLMGRLNPPDADTATDYRPYATLAQQMFVQGYVPTDVIAAHGWVRTRATDAALGITGFCMGGGIVLQSIIDSKAFAAASMFYGDVRPGTKRAEPTTEQTFAFTSRITTPLMGSFGGKDTSIKPDDVQAMFARLAAPHDVKIYPEAGHAFFDDVRDSYVASAAADAWTRTLAWFRKYLS